MEISHSSFYQWVTIGSYEKLKLIWTGWFASSEHNGPSSAKGRCNLRFLQPGRMVCGSQTMWNWRHDCQGMQTAQQEHKAPSITTRSNLEPQAGQTTASAWKQSCLHWPQSDSSLWASTGLSLPVTWGTAPGCPLSARPFPNRSPVSLPGVQLGCLCWGHGENKENSSSQWHCGCLIPLVGFGQCCSLPAAAFGSCTKIKVIYKIKGIKVQTQAWRSSTVKWMRITAAPLQCCLEPRWEEQEKLYSIFSSKIILRKKSPTVRNAMLIGKWDAKEHCGHWNSITQPQVLLEESQLHQELREDLGDQHTISLMTFLPFGFSLFFSLARTLQYCHLYTK